MHTLIQIIYAAIGVAVLLFIVYLAHVAVNPLIGKAALPAATILAILVIVLIIYAAKATEGK